MNMTYINGKSSPQATVILSYSQHKILLYIVTCEKGVREILNQQKREILEGKGKDKGWDRETEEKTNIQR